MLTGLHPRPTRWHVLPTTTLGKWASAFALAWLVFTPMWRLMGPLGAFPGFVCGAIGGGIAIVAIRHGDRAVAVSAAIVPLVFVVLFVVAELVFGNG